MEKTSKIMGKTCAEAHQQKRLRESARRIPAMGGIFGDASMEHSDRIDEAAAPTEQRLPEIGVRRRLIEQPTHRRNKDGFLAVGRY